MNKENKYLRIGYCFQLLCGLALLLVVVKANGQQLSFQEVKEITVYEDTKKGNETRLDMGYAKYEIRNPMEWTEDERTKKVFHVELVLTKYPSNTKRWVTNYDTLMNRRIRAVQTLLPELKEATTITWRITLQTNCVTEAEAMQLFHGAVIHYKVKPSKHMRTAMMDIRGIISEKKDFQDSEMALFLKSACDCFW